MNEDGFINTNGKLPSFTTHACSATKYLLAMLETRFVNVAATGWNRVIYYKTQLE